MSDYRVEVTRQNYEYIGRFIKDGVVILEKVDLNPHFAMSDLICAANLSEDEEVRSWFKGFSSGIKILF